MPKITRKELISQYLNFFKLKKHAIIPNASLTPENDPTCLFTTAGMHPLVPYILGQQHPLGKRLTSVQRCIRTRDIEEVGDVFHHTFFEMLGNWALGDYWKAEAIKMSYDFLTQVLGIPVEKLAISCFKGDDDAPQDDESAEIWKSLGLDEKKIVFLGKDKNWWGPAGKTGPCGPDTEMYVYVGLGKPKSTSNPEAKEREWCEIWNDVFVQYNKTKEGKFEHIDRKVIDTGMGVERVLTILNGLKDNYLTEIFQPAIKELEKLSDKHYGFNQDHTRMMRIIVDHIRASVFILNENTVPSNVEQGYVLRRLVRRAIRFGMRLGIQGNLCKRLAKIFIDYYKEDYNEFKNTESFILEEIEKEEIKFKETLDKGIKEFERLISERKARKLSGEDSFLLYQSFGFPFEITKDLCNERGITVSKEEFNEELGKHQELSRQATHGKFKSGLADNSETTTRLHTATHLLNQALREILKEDIQQRGSNITPERLRFDFNFERKLTAEEIKEVETIVNKKIQEGFYVKREEMSVDDALKKGAQSVFKERYGDKVSVYTICNKKGENQFSCEICAGPHVTNLKDLGHFKILKEEAVAAGVRRIKAVLE